MMNRTVKFPLSGGEYMLVDKNMVAVLNHFAPFYRSEGKYAKTVFQGKNLYAHRLIMSPRLGKVVDHINGNTLDNRKANLRVVTQLENMNNLVNYRYKYGVRGVRYREDIKKFSVQIMYHGEYTFGGCFDTLEEAQLKAKELLNERLRHQ